MQLSNCKHAHLSRNFYFIGKFAYVNILINFNIISIKSVSPLDERMHGFFVVVLFFFILLMAGSFSHKVCIVWHMSKC